MSIVGLEAFERIVKSSQAFWVQWFGVVEFDKEKEWRKKNQNLLSAKFSAKQEKLDENSNI